MAEGKGIKRVGCACPLVTPFWEMNLRASTWVGKILTAEFAEVPQSTRS